MKRITLTLGALLCGALSLGAQQTKADTAHLRDAVARWTQLRGVVNNSSGAKTMADNAIRAESLSFRAIVSRVDTIRVVRTDTLTVFRTDTLRLTRVDTVRIVRVDTVFVVAPVNKAPVANFTVPTNCVISVVCTFQSTSTDDVAVVGYSWTCTGSLPVCPATGATTSATYATAGARSVTLAVRDAAGLIGATTKTVTIGTPPPPPPVDTVTAPARAALPKVTPAFTFPAATRTTRVAVGGDLQAAFNTALPGDSIIVSGAYTGSFVLPAKPCTGWITVVSGGVLPSAGVRATPATAIGYAKIISNTSAPALYTAPLACRWRFVGVEFVGTSDTLTVAYGIVKLGAGGDEGQTTVASVPTDFVFDRVYIHGTQGHNDTRCVVLNSMNTIIANSTISECHARGFDSQAIEAWNTPGALLIENNFLGGAGENLMIGGADPANATLIPADITIRRNHIAKDPAWRGKWTVKNLTELKNARRVLYTGNVLESTWPAGQEAAVVFKSSQDSCGGCTWEGTTDVTFEWNLVRNAPVAFNLQALDPSGQVATNVPVQRVTAENNLFTNIGAEGSARLMQLTHPLLDVAIRHNTFTHAPGVKGLSLFMAYSGGAAKRLDISDNVMTATAGYSTYYDGGIVHTAALNAMVADKTWSFARNVVVGVEGQFVAANPPASWYPLTALAAGLNADGSLALTSPYLGKGLGGTNPGVDVAELLRRTAGVVTP